MTVVRFVEHHIWLLAALVLVVGVVAVVFRGRVKRLMLLAKAAATDPRLPRPVRWLFAIGLAAKLLPVDFGIDEVALGLGILLLSTKYRATWKEIREEIK